MSIQGASLLSRSLRAWGLVVGLTMSSCATMGLRSAVDMSVTVQPGTPREALVYIDGKYVGSLAAVEARGVRIPEGEHRLTVEKVGYFPYDTVIVSDLEPIQLKIELLKLPD